MQFLDSVGLATALGRYDTRNVVQDVRDLLNEVLALNVAASTTGLVDRAIVLVDPAATLLPPPPGGTWVLPLIANPNFGKIHTRRGEPRLIRVGLGLEY